MDWTLIGSLLAIAAVCLLLGAALGYWTAATDLEAEKAKVAKAARAEGFEAGMAAARAARAGRTAIYDDEAQEHA